MVIINSLNGYSKAMQDGKMLDLQLHDMLTCLAQLHRSNHTAKNYQRQLFFRSGNEIARRLKQFRVNQFRYFSHLLNFCVLTSYWRETRKFDIPIGEQCLMSDKCFYIQLKFTPKIGHTFTDKREVVVEVPEDLVRRKVEINK